MPDQRPRAAPRRNAVRFKNIAATLQQIERAQRGAPKAGGGEDVPPLKLGPLQKIVAFGPLDEVATGSGSAASTARNHRKLQRIDEAAAPPEAQAPLSGT